MQIKSYRKYEVSRSRTRLQRAKPQFWMALALVSVLAVAGLYSAGRLIFGIHYAPLTLPNLPAPHAVAQDMGTATATPTGTSDASATILPSPTGYAPWASALSPIDNGAVQMSDADRAVYQYDLPSDVRARLEADWKDIIDHFYTLPSYRWVKNPSLLTKYTAGQKLRPTPTGQRGTATPFPPGTTFITTMPGQRSVTLLGCDVTGAACQIVDIWTNITSFVYDYWTDKVIRSYPDTGAVAYTVTLKWKDGRWKLYTVSGKVVRYVTATPVGSPAPAS